MLPVPKKWLFIIAATLLFLALVYYLGYTYGIGGAVAALTTAYNQGRRRQKAVQKAQDEVVSEHRTKVDALEENARKQNEVVDNEASKEVRKFLGQSAADRAATIEEWARSEKK